MIRKIFLSAIVLAISAFGAAAQAHIESAISKIEKGNRTSNAIYSENRNPDTHQLVKSSKMLVISAADAKAVINAIERDREKAVSYERVGNAVYEVKFSSGKMRSSYTLLRQRNGSWMLTVECRPAGGKKERAVKKKNKKKGRVIRNSFFDDVDYIEMSISI